MNRYKVIFSGSFDIAAKNPGNAQRNAERKLDEQLIGIGLHWDEYQINNIKEIEQ